MTASAPAPAQRRSPPGRDKLLDAARQMFAADGFDAVSTKRLALAAGLTIGALYHHFPSKEAIYQATLRQALGQLPPMPAACFDATLSPRERLFGMFAWYSGVVAAPSDAATLLRRELLDPHLDTPVIALDVFQEAFAPFRDLMAELAPHSSVELAIATVVSLAFGMANLKGLRACVPALAPMLDDADAIARYATDLVLRGLD